MSSSKEPVYCLCGQPYDPERFMIQCDVCKDWFHGSCTGVKEHDAGDIIKYHCPNCQIAHGPSKWKVRTNWHRHDYSDPAADEKKVQTGTHVFIQELKNRQFRSGLDVTTCLSASELTLAYLDKTSFMNPLLIADKEGLGLMLPPSDLSVGDVVDFIGPDYLIDVIDVLKQESIKMTLAEFADYYTSYNRTKVFNVVSLEFSDTRLSDFVRPPTLVSQISWVEQCWPRALASVGDNRRPAVMKYCLMGAENSYTDFHIDFGGSSVWYHVLRGEKIFYLIRPTEENLIKYERWMAAADQGEIFFGDEVDSCFRLALRAGETLFIPTGWIHAVLTTTDSMVFGGNFLHSYNIGLQLSVYEMEQRLNCPAKFMFPSFETTNWFAAARVVDQLRQSVRPAPFLVNGAKALVSELRRWASEAQQPNGQSRAEAIPPQVNVPTIIKELAKEVKSSEKKWGKKKSKKDLSTGGALHSQSQALRVKLKNLAAIDTGMYDFSSSDDDSGGLVMGGEDRGTSLAASLPSISSFNNYQRKQNKKKEAKEKSTLPPNDSGPKKPPRTSPKAAKALKTPKVPAAKTAKASKVPKVMKTQKVPSPPKATKAAKEPPRKPPKTKAAAKATLPRDELVKAIPVKTSPAKTPIGTSPKNAGQSKSPKKNKAEPKGGLKLRLSIGGSTPSIDNSTPADLDGIIDMVASGGLGGQVDVSNEQFENHHQRQSPPMPTEKQLKIKKPRSSVKRPVAQNAGLANVIPDIHPTLVPPKKSRKKRPVSEAVLDAQATGLQAAAAARAAALADEVIAAVAAEVEVEGVMSDEEADPSMADPHRLTVVIPGENEEEIEAVTGSPQHEQDAIQGMLSMSGTYSFSAGTDDEIQQSKTAGNLERLKQRLAAKRGLLPGGRVGGAGGRDGLVGVMGHQRDEEDEFERALRNCRQDDDFIYLGIDANDDDWRALKKRGKGAAGGRVHIGGTDQTWSPKGVSLKGLNKAEQRPQREGVKREVMESTLAESTKFDPALGTSVDKGGQTKSPKLKGPPREKKESVMKVVKPKKEVIHKVSTEPKLRRPGKKGMATAKQRLGKILKIHRMYH